jgi:hypothetical protein
MADIRDAEAAQVLAAPPPDADRHTRHVVALHCRLDPLVKLTEQRVGVLSDATGASAAPCAHASRDATRLDATRLDATRLGATTSAPAVDAIRMRRVRSAGLLICRTASSRMPS